MDIKLFNKWDTSTLNVQDAGLKKYLSLEPVVVPRTGARHSGSRFHKSKAHIVERLINKVMVPGHKAKKHFKSSGHITGKANNAVSIVVDCLELIEKRTGKNPVEVLVTAIQNAAPREEIITIEYGGARYPKAVECSPQRRIDYSLRQMVQGAYHKAFNAKKSMVSCLCDEITAAYNMSQQSQAISKKLELERQADASR